MTIHLRLPSDDEIARRLAKAFWKHVDEKGTAGAFEAEAAEVWRIVAEACERAGIEMECEEDSEP